MILFIYNEYVLLINTYKMKNTMSQAAIELRNEWAAKGELENFTAEEIQVINALAECLA